MKTFLCIKPVVVVALMVMTTAYVKGEVRMPGIFGDNMVLQQQSEVALWGWAKAGTSVKVTAQWSQKTYSTMSDSKGYWKIKIRTPSASYTPYTLTVSDGKAVTLKNILIGEVWVCSGQSNMEMSMRFNVAAVGASDDILHSTNAGIRHIKVPLRSKSTPQEDFEGEWKAANPETTPDFSAAAYYFGKLLNSVLNVPVGLINVSWGGSVVEAWMTPASLKDIPEKVIPATDEDIKIINGSPGVLYNGMLHQLAGFGIRGAIWYQGESNKIADDAPELYVRMFDRMVRGWRDVWGIGDFPFYYCQLAPYNYAGNFGSGSYHSAYFREAQTKGMLTPNTGMAVLMDAESPDDIHPTKKKDVGERLALWALAKDYGLEKLRYRSPEYKAITVEGRIAILSFDMFSPDGRSFLTSYGKDIRHFTIAGKDKRFFPAVATINGNMVYVFAPQVKEPVAVRYCWNDTSGAEIFSMDGHLPVSSFRTDTWGISED